MTQAIDFTELSANIKAWGQELGFADLRVTDIDVSQADQRLSKWLAAGFHGEMAYLTKHRELRANPDQMVPGAVRIITARMNYLPPDSDMLATLKNPSLAYVSRYALGRDYHKLIRKRLHKLADKISEVTGEFGFRTFADSAPVFEKPIAQKAGLGWMGKNTLILNREAGSWFFLGTIYTTLPLLIDEPISEHCGSCTACLDVCPTKAFVAPYKLDARRCISYLTIELKGSIPVELRPLMGNRIFGCDDCQIICPWNKFANFTKEKDFHPRHKLQSSELVTLFAWSEQTFLKNTEGSAIRRASYEGWLRNIAVALGNAPTSTNVIEALNARLNHPSNLVREHVEWALMRHA